MNLCWVTLLEVIWVLDGLDVDSSGKEEDSANWGKEGLPARNMN